MEWLNTTQLKYPDCVCIVESDTCPSPGVTRLYPSWLGTWLTWSPSGHCNMQWDTCYHLVAMAAGRELLNNHITRLHHEEYWNIHRKFKTPKWHSNISKAWGALWEFVWSYSGFCQYSVVLNCSALGLDYNNVTMQSKYNSSKPLGESTKEMSDLLWYSEL